MNAEDKDRMLPVEVKLKLSKQFPPGVEKISFGRYELKPIPSSNINEHEVLLSFNAMLAGGAGNPIGEAGIVSKLLSLFIEGRVQIEGWMVNHVDTPQQPELEKRMKYPQFYDQLNPDKLDYYVNKVFSLGDDLTRQFVRACYVYSFALEFIKSDPTFAFFLLVVAIECMSGQDKVISYDELHPDSQKCDRFKRFINKFLLEEFKGEDERNEKLFDELLRNIYYSLRSAFVHGGSEVSPTTEGADIYKSSYFKSYDENGKEIKTPGIGWFAKIVRGSLLGFLNSLSESSIIDNEVLSRLAFEKVTVRLKSKRPIRRGQPVTDEDIEYR